MTGAVSGYVIRDIRSLKEIKQVEEMQSEVWGFSDRDIIPAEQLIPAVALGGILIGGFHEDRLAGFVYGFLGREHGRLLVHSQMLAVSRPHRGEGLGRALKLAQRERALASGIDWITWTFDPLQCANAHFNFARLGALCDSYRINFYGETTSSFLHGYGTDRLWVSWPIAGRRVEQRLNGGWDPEQCRRRIEGASVVLAPDSGDHPRRQPEGFGAPILRIEVPNSAASNPELTRAWRAATQEAFLRAMGEGYIVTEFCRLPDGGYLLEKGSLAGLA